MNTVEMAVKKGFSKYLFRKDAILSFSRYDCKIHYHEIYVEPTYVVCI